MVETPKGQVFLPRTKPNPSLAHRKLSLHGDWIKAWPSILSYPPGSQFWMNKTSKDRLCKRKSSNSSLDNHPPCRQSLQLVSRRILILLVPWRSHHLGEWQHPKVHPIQIKTAFFFNIILSWPLAKFKGISSYILTHLICFSAQSSDPSEAHRTKGVVFPLVKF